MFDWIFGTDVTADAQAEYWEDADAGKAHYDSIRGASWADPDEWERNLQRSEGED